MKKRIENIDPIPEHQAFLENFYYNLPHLEIDFAKKEKFIQRLKNIHPMKGRAEYFIDYAEKKVHSSGTFDLLGYTEEEFDYDLIFNFFHPNQKEFMSRLIAAIIKFAIDGKFMDKSHFLTVVSKIRKKDGSYLIIMRHSNSLMNAKDGTMLLSYSLLVDVSDIFDSEKIVWKASGDNLDMELLSNYVHAEYANFFTPQELKIIRLIKADKTSKEIGEVLHISKHTVDTHRRKIHAKAQCKTSRELLRFCDKYIPNYDALNS